MVNQKQSFAAVFSNKKAPFYPASYISSLSSTEGNVTNLIHNNNKQNVCSFFLSRSLTSIQHFSFMYNSFSASSTKKNRRERKRKKMHIAGKAKTSCRRLTRNLQRKVNFASSNSIVFILVSSINSFLGYISCYVCD